MTEYIIILFDYDSCNDEVPTRTFGPFNTMESARNWANNKLPEKKIDYRAYRIMPIECPWPDLQP
jgi:hypothetical protein